VACNFFPMIKKSFFFHLLFFAVLISQVFGQLKPGDPDWPIVWISYGEPEPAIMLTGMYMLLDLKNKKSLLNLLYIIKSLLIRAEKAMNLQGIILPRSAIRFVQKLWSL
jgi:hypothetical protein